MQRILFSLVLGALIGGLAVSFFSRSGSAELPVDAPLHGDGVVATAPAPEVALAPPERVAAERSPQAGEPESEGLISAALRRHADEGLRKGWKSVRQDEIPDDDFAEGMGQFEKIVRESPQQIGKSLGERRTKAEAALADAKSGGVFKLLESLDAGGVGPLPGLVRDPAQLEPLFQRMIGEEFRDGLANHARLDDAAEDGVTLTWPAGVFRVADLMKHKDPFPRDVTLAGAGMNATMLVLSDDLMTRGELRNFSVRDCTLNTNNNYLFDLRVQPAAFHCERVRFIGFDMGAGASCLFGTEGLAMWARNCRFEGGYGNSPQHGIIFDVRTDALLARFDSCSLSLVSLRVSSMRPGATVLFSGCSLEEILDDPVTDAANHPGVIFDQCSIARHQGGWQTVPKLDLNDLFPDWKKRME